MESLMYLLLFAIGFYFLARVWLTKKPVRVVQVKQSYKHRVVERHNDTARSMQERRSFPSQYR